MLYDVIVKGYRNAGGRMVVARHLAREESMSLQEALEKADHLPVTVFKAKDRLSISPILHQFTKLGIDTQTIAVGHPSRDDDHTSRSDLSRNGADRNAAVQTGPGTSRHHTGLMASLSKDTPHRCLGSQFKRWSLPCAGILLTAGVLYGIAVILRMPDRNVQRTGISTAILTDPSHMTGTDVSLAARERARTLIDSAQGAHNDVEAAIRFYKMAIGFNKHNINAWRGLLECYRRSGQSRDETLTRQEMYRLFGRDIFSIDAIIRPFGTLEALHSDGETLCVEYRTSSPADQARLIQEAFLVYRAIHADCDCSVLSLLIQKDDWGALSVQVKAHEDILSADMLKKKGTVRFIRAPYP